METFPDLYVWYAPLSTFEFIAPLCPGAITYVKKENGIYKFVGLIQSEEVWHAIGEQCVEPPRAVDGDVVYSYDSAGERGMDVPMAVAVPSPYSSTRKDAKAVTLRCLSCCRNTNFSTDLKNLWNSLEVGQRLSLFACDDHSLIAEEMLSHFPLLLRKDMGGRVHFVYHKGKF